MYPRRSVTLGAQAQPRHVSDHLGDGRAFQDRKSMTALTYRSKSSSSALRSRSCGERAAGRPAARTFVVATSPFFL